MMAEKNGPTDTLDPRRNQTVERKKLFEEMLLKDMPGTARTNEPMHAVLEGELHESNLLEGSASQNVRNRALLQYLATLANSNSRDDRFDFDFVQSLLNNGADVNSTDKTGQTVFHEIARSWNIDVASFLIKNGANVNQQDQYGRSPLHVAAAVDYAEMVEFLLENGADIDITTSGEGQAPIHYAAKNDAINSLQMLLGYGANIDARDNKNRTPLQVSAEMNRSKAAKLLIAEGAPAGVYDNLGNSALSLLIEKIPEVALDAMDQFHSVDTINRKEFYFLNYLEGTKLRKEKTPARTPLEIAVQNERFDIIMHPVIQRLIGVKWQIYGKWGAVFDLALNLIYTVLWTVLAVTLPDHGRDLYTPLGRNSWRVIIVILITIFTLREMRKQIVNTTKTRQELKNWREWRAAELERDLAYCHPRWPQEAQYLTAEIKAVRNLSLISGSDWWIYFDWAALVLILATIASHVTFFHYSNDISKEVHHYVIIPLLLILWLRIFKYARPFESAGPFIVIFGSVLGDIVKWGFLNTIIIIPFTCAFWITFGAISLKPVPGYNSFGPLLYNIFSMMVVNSHDYDDLEKANPVMARLLCGSFIGIAAIVTLNLLIALLSNTFERHYENAVANAVMQRARTILLLQKSLRKSQKNNYYDFINTNGSPEIIVKTLGRLLTMEGDDRATIERVRDDVKVIVGILGEKFGKKFGKGKKSDMDFVKMDVSKIRRFQDELIADVKNMKQAFREITEKVEEMNNNHSRHMEQALQEITIRIEEMNNNNARETKQALQEVTEKMEEIKLCSSSNDNQQGVGKTSEEHSDDLEKESCDDTSDDESNATSNRHTQLTRLKTRSEQHDHKEQTKTPTKAKYKASDLADETVKTKGGGDRKEDAINQQLAYLHQPSSTFSDIPLLHNRPFDNARYVYPSHHHAGSLRDYDPRKMENIAIKTFDQVPYNNQWFAPRRSSVPQHHELSHPGFQQRQDMGQQHGYGPVLPNFNQFSLYETRQPAIQYFDRRFSHTPAHRAPTENTRLFQSAPYVKQPLTTNRFQRPPATQEAENTAYGYENYGFEPINEEINQHMSTGFRPLIVNSPFTYDEYEQPRRTIQPSVSPLSHEQAKPEYTPMTQKLAPVRQTYDVQKTQSIQTTSTHPASSLVVQKHDIRRHSIPRTVATQSSSFQIQIRPPQLKKVLTTEISPAETQAQTKESPHSQTTEDLIGAEETGKLQTPPIQSVPEILSTSVNEDIELQLATEAEPDVPQNTLTEEGQLVSNEGASGYNERRPSTPISPKTVEKVMLLQGTPEKMRLIESTGDDETADGTKVPMQSNVESSYSSTDDPQMTEQQETDESISTEESPVQERDEDGRDIRIQLSPTDLEMNVENKTTEEIYSEKAEEDFPDVMFSPVQAEIEHVQDSPSDT